jgi:hypothetical protein
MGSFFEILGAHERNVDRVALSLSGWMDHRSALGPAGLLPHRVELHRRRGELVSTTYYHAGSSRRLGENIRVGDPMEALFYSYCL